MSSFSLTVNGELTRVEHVEDGESLLFVLRERLGLMGSKNACEQGECGSCSVWVDNEMVCACLVLAESARDSQVVTVEGLASREGGLTDVQRAMVETGAIQCGFCTPGLVVAIHELLERSSDPQDLEIREAISGNLCRCTGYGRILEAVRVVLDERSSRRRT